MSSAATTTSPAQRHLGEIVEHTDIVLAFGGMALKNSVVAGGGISRTSSAAT